MRDGFILHEKTLQQINRLDPEEVVYLLACMTEFYNYGTVDIDKAADFSTAVAVILDDAIERMAADADAYEKSVENKKKAASKRWNKDTDGMQSNAEDMQCNAEQCNSNAEDAVSVSVSVPVSVNTKENSPTESKRKAFVPPTVEEVRAYCIERQNTVDAEQFVDFYASKGWKVGSQAMKDWKACVRTWEKRETQKPAAPPGRKTNKFVNFDRNRDNDALMAQIIGRAEGRI